MSEKTEESRAGMPVTGPTWARMSAASEVGEAYQACLAPEFRKRHGIWYTPPDLAIGLAAEAARLMLADERPDPARVRVLDPACGGGIFLVAAREVIGPVAAELSLDRVPAIELVGADIDSGALEMARLALGSPEGGKPPSRRLEDPASGQIQAVRQSIELLKGDALLDVDFSPWAEGFDLVITNPPYVRADGGPEIADLRRRVEASGRFESLAAKWDLAAAFVERGLQLCRPGGLAVYLLQDTYRKAAYARAQHAWLGSGHAIRRLELFGGLRAFDAGVGSLALYVQRGPARKSRGAIVVKRDGDRVEARTVSPGSPPETVFGWESSKRNPGEQAQLEDLAFISYGLRANSDERRFPGAFVTADLLRDAPYPPHVRKYTEGKDLGGFRVLRTRYLEWGTDRAPGRFARRSFPEFLEAAPKILALCISGREVKAAIDEEGHAFNHTAIGILPWSSLKGVSNAQVSRATRDVRPDTAPAVDIRYLLAILHARRTREALWRIRRSDKHIYPDDWRQVSVPLCSADLQAAIGAAIDVARSLPFPSAGFTVACDQLQSLVDSAFRTAAGR